MVIFHGFLYVYMAGSGIRLAGSDPRHGLGLERHSKAQPGGTGVFGASLVAKTLTYTACIYNI